MIRLSVNLSPEERNALFKYADLEMRPPRDQIRIILRGELLRRGFLENKFEQSINAIADPENLGGSTGPADDAPSKLEDT